MSFAPNMVQMRKAPMGIPLMKIEATREARIVGSMLREARVLGGMTQRELSAQLIQDGWTEATRSWLSRLEAGDVTLKAWDLLHLRTVLGKSFEGHFWNLFPERGSEPPPRRRRRTGPQEKKYKGVIGGEPASIS